MSDQITIDTLIELLTEMRSKHGNLKVTIIDADTSWGLKVKSKNISVQKERLVIKCGYGYPEDGSSWEEEF